MKPAEIGAVYRRPEKGLRGDQTYGAVNRADKFWSDLTGCNVTVPGVWLGDAIHFSGFFPMNRTKCERYSLIRGIR